MAVIGSIIRNFKHDQYEPLEVIDQLGTEYICLDKYQAGNIRALLVLLQEEYNANPGDWFTDVPTKIPRDWQTDYHSLEVIRQIKEIEMGKDKPKKEKKKPKKPKSYAVTGHEGFGVV